MHAKIIIQLIGIFPIGCQPLTFTRHSTSAWFCRPPSSRRSLVAAVVVSRPVGNPTVESITGIAIGTNSSLSTHQCATSLSIGESNHSLVRHLLASQGHAGLSDQHEGRVVSQGHCDGDIHGAVDQKAHDRDRSGTGGERGRK